MLHDKKELIEEVQGLKEGKSMLITTVKKIEKKAEKLGIEKGIQKKAIQTAKALIIEKMPVKKISEITGLSLQEIEN